MLYLSFVASIQEKVSELLVNTLGVVVMALLPSNASA